MDDRRGGQRHRVEKPKLGPLLQVIDGMLSLGRPLWLPFWSPADRTLDT